MATLGRQSSPGDLLPNTVRYVPAGRRTPPITPRNQRLRSASEGTNLLCNLDPASHPWYTLPGLNFS